MTRPERHLVEALKGPMKALGFKYAASRSGFFRQEPFGFCVLMWASYPTGAHGGAQIISPGLGVRHDAVDNVVNQLGHIWGDDNRRYTTTVYRDMGFFPFDPERDGEKAIRYSSPDQDIADIVANFLEMLSADGDAFYQRYSSLLECSQGLNEPIEGIKHPLLNNFPMRAYYGVAAAALAEPDRVPSLIAAYLEFVRRDQLGDASVVYDVGKELSGVEAVRARLEFVAGRASELRRQSTESP
jgi:hypothetical protein